MEGNDSSDQTSFNITPFFQTRQRGGIPKFQSLSAWDNVVAEEWSKFQLLHDRCIKIFDKVESSLLMLGLLGNLLAIVTLFRGRHMRTPSFVYHKALLLAYLIYCLNFLIVKYVNMTLTVPRQLSYYSPIVAYYAIILNRVITSVCGYLALYTSLAISIDRLLALVMYSNYSKFNRHIVAYVWVATSLLLSVCFHSWAPWLENDIQAIAVQFNKDSNETVLTYRHRQSPSHDQLKPYLMAKDWYNLIIRFAYAILLIGLTCIVIYMFSQQQKRRSSLCNVQKRQLRKERSLFYLMIAVVIMTYIQVIPREGKRILELIYPQEYVASKIEDSALSIETKKKYLLFGLYGFTFTTPILNLCTTIERSLLFYLYFALNHTFRRDVLILLHLKSLWESVLGKTRSSTSPDTSRTSRQYSYKSVSRLLPSGKDGRSPSIASQSKTCVGGTKRQVRHMSYGTAEYGNFMSSPVNERKKAQQCSSSQTMCIEYFSVI